MDNQTKQSGSNRIKNASGRRSQKTFETLARWLVSYKTSHPLDSRREISQAYAAQFGRPLGARSQMTIERHPLFQQLTDHVELEPLEILRKTFSEIATDLVDQYYTTGDERIRAQLGMFFTKNIVDKAAELPTHKGEIDPKVEFEELRSELMLLLRDAEIRT